MTETGPICELEHAQERIKELDDGVEEALRCLTCIGHNRRGERWPDKAKAATEALYAVYRRKPQKWDAA